MSLMVNLLAVLLIAFIVWWFWLARLRHTRMAADSIDVVVDGGVYTPAAIEVPRGKKVILNFIRRDASPCAEKVIFDDLGVSADLPLGQAIKIELIPQDKGEHEFTCQMGMYRGKLIVK